MRQKTEDRRQKTERLRRGSAIILAVVLTTLLAILGVLFLFSSRVDSVATSAVGDNHDLKLAVDTVVAQISEVLTNNVPGADANYYNYPDNNNSWLASLEPNDVNLWPHITDLYSQFGTFAYDLAPAIIYDRGDTAGNGVPADADGDGVSDSMWVQIRDVNSSKGKPVYVAIRIIDNGGMLNVNTGYKFDPSVSVGDKQSDINLMALSWRPNNTLFPYNSAVENTFLPTRNTSVSDLANYENNVVWQYGAPATGTYYTPFDISDELEMRYRFDINQDNTNTRLESWSSTFDFNVITHPYDNGNGNNKYAWFTHTHNSGSFEPNYTYRHIVTTYNMDRVIEPNGSKMFNVNLADMNNIINLRNKIRTALEPNENDDANQIAVNLIDYVDTDSNVTYFVDLDTVTPHEYFGFERPCIYISEIAQDFNEPGTPEDTSIYRSYAIELYKPYSDDGAPNGWQIETFDDITNKTTFTSINWTGSKHFHVLANIDTNANIPIDESDSDTQKADINFAPGPGHPIRLWRDVNCYGVIKSMLVDSLDVCEVGVNGSDWMRNTSSSVPHSFERDINLHRCIRRVLNPNMTTPTIGKMNNYDSSSVTIQAHPRNGKFINVGEIGQLLRKNAYSYSIDQSDKEEDVRLNLADPCVQNLFNYLTVIDPCDHSPIDPNETRIKGRININTAPWFVLAQLPWISYHTTNYDLAREIVAYRDKTIGPSGTDYSSRSGPYGFRNIGELMQVSDMNYYQGRTAIPTTLLTPSDCNGPLEERDLIFDRISNLVTVRSDVFTAYILVRIGPSGPQKRVIAIFDRSGVRTNPDYDPVTNPNVIPHLGKVKIVAIQSVPDPR